MISVKNLTNVTLALNILKKQYPKIDSVLTKFKLDVRLEKKIEDYHFM